MANRIQKLNRTREKGFTLVESLLVVGLTTLIAVGVVVGFMEGLDTLHTLTDTQSVGFGHQRAMNQFINDVQSATWFFNGYTHDEDELEIMQETSNPYLLILGYQGPEDTEVWIKYRTRVAPFSRETYLMRTVSIIDRHQETGGPVEQVETGSSALTTGVADLEFNCYDADGGWTDQLLEIKSIMMKLSVNIGGATVQREYMVTLRNPNMGIKDPIFDFNEIEAEHFMK